LVNVNVTLLLFYSEKMLQQIKLTRDTICPCCNKEVDCVLFELKHPVFHEEENRIIVEPHFEYSCGCTLMPVTVYDLDLKGTGYKLTKTV